MTLIFPSFTPDFIQIVLPEYVTNIQEFNTTEFYQKNYQTSPIGLVFECRTTCFSKAASDLVVQFYYEAKHQAFSLPNEFTQKFPASIISSLALSTLWEFSSNVQVNPKKINRKYFVSEVLFNIRNVLS